ncbi:MAG TPA: hypothetical protein VIM55_17070 [Mucilaginibacter sp.]
MLVALKDEEVENSFLEIKKYLTRAVDGLKEIDPENKNNHKEIFDRLELEIKNFNTMKLIQRMTRLAGSAIGLASSIKGLF